MKILYIAQDVQAFGHSEIQDASTAGVDVLLSHVHAVSQHFQELSSKLLVWCTDGQYLHSKCCPFRTSQGKYWYSLPSRLSSYIQAKLSVFMSSLIHEKIMGIMTMGTLCVNNLSK